LEFDAMINRTSSEAKDLIALAERMGIPAEVAIPVVMQHLSGQEPSEVVEPRRLVRRKSA
jgi:hypothetical protein